MIRRILISGALVLAIVLAVVFGSGAGGNGGAYEVRAIFDNGSFLIAGQDVKVAGAKVGTVASLDVADQNGDACRSGNCKAAVVLRIDRAGFKDFRSDARCAIQLQSVIGEKLVTCTPTDPGSNAPPLQKIPDGHPGAGQRLLPLASTSTPVDADLINNIQRRPFRERLSILLSEFGTALAARAGDLRAVVQRANPALKQFDRFLGILAGQNKMLRELTKNADTVLTALARERRHVGGFFSQSRIAAQATAEKRADLERNFQRFPAFLRQLRPFMNRFDELSTQMAPVIANLRTSGRDISRFLVALGPFSRATIPALRTLGNAADIGRPALKAVTPVARTLNSFALKARGVSRNLRLLTTSLQDHKAIERAMDLLYYVTLSTNGFTELGHYLRNALIVTVCSGYSITPTVGCSANFAGGSSSSATASASVGSMASRLIDAIVGRPKQRRAQSKQGSSNDAKTQPALQTAPAPAPASGPTGPAAQSPSKPAPKRAPTVNSGKDDPLLDYLLGGGQ
jgi:ABC-type transporter Mla subunit MlaD